MVGDEDLRFPSTAINPPGAASDPTRSTTSGLLYFAGNADNTVVGVAQMPHGWDEGTPIEPHLHLVFPTSAAANTRWLLEYTRASIGSDAVYDGAIPTAAANAITYANSMTVLTVANPQAITKAVYASFGDIAMTGYRVSSCILRRLSRLASSDGADNDANACVLVEFDIHYRSIRHGREA
jgi:hypothetical protein